MARSVVVLPAPLVPRMRDDLAGCDRKRDALHRRDGALVDDLELVDGEQRVGHRPRSRRLALCLNGHSRK